jgi:hypothetical protein
MILAKMVIDDEQNQSKRNFFFLIEFILICSPLPKVRRVSSWGMVENLDTVEKVNWPKIIFDNLHDSFAKLNVVKDELGKQHYFSGCAPIFDVII